MYGGSRAGPGSTWKRRGIIGDGAVVSFQIRSGMTRGTEFLFEIYGPANFFFTPSRFHIDLEDIQSRSDGILDGRRYRRMRKELLLPSDQLPT